MRTYAVVCVGVCACLFVCTLARARVCVLICLCIHLNVCACVYMCAHACARTLHCQFSLNGSDYATERSATKRSTQNRERSSFHTVNDTTFSVVSTISHGQLQRDAFNL